VEWKAHLEEEMMVEVPEEETGLKKAKGLSATYRAGYLYRSVEEMTDPLQVAEHFHYHQHPLALQR